MKQCPTCGHRTNDDVCPVCGAATVVLQNDPQEKAQRTIQYQRFDPSKAPGATAGGQAVPTGNRYTQKDPGAMHHMQQGAGMIPPQGGQQEHPAKAAPQPNPQGQPAAPAQQAQRPVAPEAQAAQNQVPAQQPITGTVGQAQPATANQPSGATVSPAAPGADPAGLHAPAPAAQQPAAPTPQNTGGNTQGTAPNTQQHPAAPVQQPQQPVTGDSRDITYQHMNEFRPSTLPRRSQKYRQKYSSYIPSEPAAEAMQPARPQDAGTPNAQQQAVTPGAQVDPAAQAAPKAQATPAVQAALADLAAQSPQPVQPAAESPQAPNALEPQATPVDPAAQAIQTTQAAQAAQVDPSVQTAPAAPEPQPIPTMQEPSELHTEKNAEIPAADEKPAAEEKPTVDEKTAAHHVLLSPEELEAFLDNQPDDAEEDGLPAEAVHAEGDDQAAAAEASLKSDGAAESDDPNGFHQATTPETVTAPVNAADLEDSSETDDPASASDAGQIDAIDDLNGTSNTDNIVDANSDISADNADNTPGIDDPGNADNTSMTDNADNPDGSDGSSETEDELEEEHLPTRQELIQRQNAQIRRENNRKYAEEHASRAARRWQKESEEEPFAIVRGTCYYSALESETTVRGNFSKKRYKDDELPQNEPVSYEDSEWYQGFETADDPWGDYVEPGEKKKGVSYKAWFIILLLIIFWPAGLILMWVRKKFPLAVRIIITLIIAAGLAGEGYFLYHYGPAMYEEYMYGDSSNITYETPDSDSSSQGEQTAAATENQQKALDKANEYVNTLALSHDGLVKQLEYDGYSTDVATYAADNCDTNWNKEAKEMAEQYMESTTYTYKAMVQQLQAEGFTKDQAEFGAKAAGLK